MKWYEKTYNINGTEVLLEGSFEESTIRIVASFWVDPDDVAGGMAWKCLFEKPVNMWAHQEILAEDVLAKYIGKIKKCENNLPSLVEREKLNKRI